MSNTQLYLKVRYDSLRKLFLVLLVSAVVLSCSLVHAQTPHSVQISWQASTTPGVHYKVYRAPMTGTTEGTFAVLAAATDVSGLTFTDTTVTAGAKYAFYVTSFCGTTTSCASGLLGESVPSMHVSATIPTDVPNPPGTVTITNVAMLINPKKSVVTASWTSPELKTNYTIYSYRGTTLVPKTRLTSTTGVYNLTDSIRRQTNPVTLKVCDSQGCTQATSTISQLRRTRHK